MVSLRTHIFDSLLMVCEAGQQFEYPLRVERRNKLGVGFACLSDGAFDAAIRLMPWDAHRPAITLIGDVSNVSSKRNPFAGCGCFRDLAEIIESHFDASESRSPASYPRQYGPETTSRRGGWV